ncbi:MAG: hypothetical protein GY772_29130 [bacterium]|nr:hypothetical protein [bacterium]
MAQRTPISEQRRLVARWRKSNLSVSRFARSVGVPDSTFWRWTRTHTAGVVVVPTTPAFIEVTAEPVVEPVAVQVQVQGMAGVLLTFDALPDATWFGAVVREVTAC